MMSRVKSIISQFVAPLLAFVVFSFIGVPLYSQGTFTEVSEKSGVVHANVAPDYMGGGVAFFDYNNDGFEDIYLTGGIKDDKLFRNNGDGSFTDVSLESGINDVVPAKKNAVVTGDINNDGFRDIFIAVQGSKPNFLFLNNGNGTFKEISESAGIKGDQWSMGAAFGDVNLDGFLDLYVINYIKNNSILYDENNVANGFAHTCYSNDLYINNGDNTFTEQSVATGTADTGCGLAVAFTDFDKDDNPDIYIANDFGAWITPNRAFRNSFNSTIEFTDLSNETGLDAAVYGMGIAVGDYDHDGMPDYYVSNLGRNVLLHNEGDGTFADVAEASGVGNEKIEGLLSTSWGTAFLDYDLDGWEDLFVSNGYMPSAKFIETQNEDPNKLYRNLGNGAFEDVSQATGIDDALVGRGMATADYDNDGDVDLAVSNVNIVSATAINSSLYKNNNDNNYNWIKVRLEGTESNRDAFGAKVLVFAKDQRWLREIDGGSSHGSQSSSIAHIGLAAINQLDSIIIRWPGGFSQKIEDVDANQTIYIKEADNGYKKVGCMDMAAMNYDADATYNTGCRYEAVTGVKQALENTIRTYPNPVQDKLKIIVPPYMHNSQLTLKLFDVSGSKTFLYPLRGNSIDFTGSDIQSGVYFYQLLSDDFVVHRGKLIFE